jgi:phosphatidylserine/phosphatidylglycerophosphate/cardiolipin synthase-like enzyme
MNLLHKLLPFFICCFLLTACNSRGFNQQNGASPTPEEETETETNTPTPRGSLTVYFSQPNANSAKTQQGGPETHLISAIDQARISIDVAIYELSLKNVTQHLINAHQRDVRVRVLTDSDNIAWTQIQALRSAGIAIKGDQRSALMHNKFTVIDKKQVWTGSMNYTTNGAYHHNENLLKIDSIAAATNYTEEFEQLWGGIHRQINTSDNVFIVNNHTVKVYFSPDDHFRSRSLIPLLQSATKSVHFMAFAFTSTDITHVLSNLKKQGIEIKGVVDQSQSGSSYAQYDDLKSENIDVLLDGNPKKLHHKVMIIDNRYVVTGSYNFSQSAEIRNDENSVVIDDSLIAAQYEQEFRRVYQTARQRKQKPSDTFLKPPLPLDLLIDY